MGLLRTKGKRDTSRDHGLYAQHEHVYWTWRLDKGRMARMRNGTGPTVRCSQRRHLGACICFHQVQSRVDQLRVTGAHIRVHPPTPSDFIALPFYPIGEQVRGNIKVRGLTTAVVPSLLDTVFTFARLVHLVVPPSNLVIPPSHRPSTEVSLL
jgi:hypothetical protein